MSEARVPCSPGEEVREVAASGDTGLMLQLLDRGAPFILDMTGQTALHVAAHAGHVASVAALIDRGCDPNILDCGGRSALQLAAAGGHLELARLLLEAGAAVDHQDEADRLTALHLAAERGFSQTVSLLCAARANVYIKNRSGFAALHAACQHGHNQTCRVLLTSGCRPDIKNNYGDAPLHTAARYGHAGVTRILVSGRARVSGRNKNGDTALHIAAAMNKRKLARILVQAGVSTELRNNQGETAVNIATRKQQLDIVRVIETAAATRVQGVAGVAAPLLNIITDLDTSNNNNTNSRVSKREHQRPGSNVTDTGTATSKTSGRRAAARRRRAARPGAGAGCDCDPLLARLSEAVARDRRQIVTQIQASSSRLHSRLDSLERRTRHEVRTFEETMKESLAEERGSCQERLDRRLARARLETGARTEARDQQLRTEIAGWLEAIITDLEHGRGEQENPDQEVVIRKLMRRKSKRETKAIWSEIRAGVLRRTNSVEELCEAAPAPALASTAPAPARARVRHNSEGNYAEVSAAAAAGAGLQCDEPGTDNNVYENVTFFQGAAKFGDKRKNAAIEMNSYHNCNADIHKFISHHSSRSRAAAADDYEQIAGPKASCDSGSVDSHNDSGYGTRLGHSSSSPELTDSDTHAPGGRAPYYSSPYIYTNNSVVISPSSLV